MCLRGLERVHYKTFFHHRGTEYTEKSLLILLVRSTNNIKTLCLCGEK